MSKPSQKQLQDQINFEKAKQWELYYSYALKAGKTFGMDITRLFVFNRTRDQLFYLNEKQNLPFSQPSKVPISSKGVIKPSKAVIKPNMKIKKLNLVYSEADPKNKSKTIKTQWDFSFKSQKLLKQWSDLLMSHQKQVKIIEQKGLPQSMKKQMKQSYHRPKQNDDDEQAQDALKFLISDSKLIVNKPQNENMRESQNSNNKNIANSNVSQNNPKKEQKPNNGNNNKNIGNSDISQNNQTNPKKEQKPNNNNNNRKGNKEYDKDWNNRFRLNPSMDIIYEFQSVAKSSFGSVIEKHIQKKTSDMRNYEVNGLEIMIVQKFTEHSKRLKNQFRNYHYIIECLENPILNVPLTCLIEYNGFVGLVKAPIIKDAPIFNVKGDSISFIKEIQRFTHIKNQTLLKSPCILYDLGPIFDPDSKNVLVYIDNLTSYLPQFSSKSKKPLEFLARPALIFQNNSVIAGGPMNEKVQKELLGLIEEELKDVGKFLSSEEVYITNILDLKELLHDRGINLKNLLKVKKATKNKFVKKYIQSALTAKTCKDILSEEIIQIGYNNNTKDVSYVQNFIKLLLENNNSESNEMWKKVSKQFQMSYGQGISFHDLEGGFFLSCLISLIPAKYNLKALNKEKKIFFDEEIIQAGFVQALLPKIKSYYRFRNSVVQLAKHSQKSQKVYEDIFQAFDLKNKPLPDYFQLQSRKYILGYLSDFINQQTQQLKSKQEMKMIVNEQPPCAASLKITNNYLDTLLVSQNHKQFQKVVEKSLHNINYWLGQDHPQICGLLDKLAAYQFEKGDLQAGMALLERSISISQSCEGKNKKKLGSRYYILGKQYLKIGKKKNAYEYLEKARSYLKNQPEKQHQYALVLLSLSSLELSNGKTNNSIQLGNQAIKIGNDNVKDQYLIKGYEILCRGLQINEDWDKLRKLGLQCGKKFNDTQIESVFMQMIKICLTGGFAKLSANKRSSLLKIGKWLLKNNEVKGQDQSLKRMMELAKECVVMEKFLNKVEGSQRVWKQIQNQRALNKEQKDFVQIVGLSIGCVGFEFLEGLQMQSY